LPSEPRWLTADEVIQLNQTAVELTGEPFHLRDRGLLESACARPQQHFHYESQTDVIELSVILLLAVARNHPFTQGNKRTAFAAAVAFLHVNGWSLDGIVDGEPFAEVIIDAIVGRSSDEVLFVLMKVHAKPHPT
jgi:death on curing protein